MIIKWKGFYTVVASGPILSVRRIHLWTQQADWGPHRHCHHCGHRGRSLARCPDERESPCWLHPGHWNHDGCHPNLYLCHKKVTWLSMSTISFLGSTTQNVCFMTGTFALWCSTCATESRNRTRTKSSGRLKLLKLAILW